MARDHDALQEHEAGVVNGQGALDSGAAQLAQEQEMEYRPMTCGEHIKRRMEKP